jgi:sugar phosphate isomerase/epimerase
MFKTGISTACFFEKNVTENSFETLKQMRCTDTEVFLTSFFEYEPKFIEQLVLRKGDIKVHSVHALGTQFEPQLFSKSSRVRNDAELFFRKVCIAGKMLEADFYVFHGPLYFKNKKYNIDFPAFGRRMRELCAIAKNYGLLLAYENVHYSYFSEPEFWNRLQQYCPEIYGVLDVKHAALSGYDVQKYIDVMRDRIALVHICDLDKQNKTCLPGDGRMDYEKFVKSLVKVDFDGPILLEVYADDYDDNQKVKDGFDYLTASLMKFRSVNSALRREAIKEAEYEAEKDRELMEEVLEELQGEKRKKVKIKKKKSEEDPEAFLEVSEDITEEAREEAREETREEAREETKEATQKTQEEAPEEVKEEIRIDEEGENGG